SLAPVLAEDGANARLFAAPSAFISDGALAGNPNALAAASGREVLALGSLDARTSSATSLSGYGPDTISVHGTLSLDFANRSTVESRIAVAFLDPTAVGASADQLVLSMELNSTPVFYASFASADEILAGLDDVVVELGRLSPGSGAHLEVSITMNLVR